VADGPVVRIEYCVPCSARPYAVNLATRVLEEFESHIDSLDLVMGSRGIFEVHVDGDLVFEKKMIGRYPEPDDVMPLLRARLTA
jgi:selenoprotein W-related protein